MTIRRYGEDLDEPALLPINQCSFYNFTRAEHLEFQRRLILTEDLFDSIEEYSKIKTARRFRSKIQTFKLSSVRKIIVLV